MNAPTTSEDYFSMIRLGRQIDGADGTRDKFRLAILSDHATQQLTLILKSALWELDFTASIYEAEYGSAAFEAHDQASGLYAFAPEAVLFSIAVQKYRDRFLSCRSSDERLALPGSYLGEVLDVIDAISRMGIGVVVNNFALPIERMFGNYSALTDQSLFRSVIRFNAMLADAISQRANCAINDVMYVAAQCGASAFFDERFWTSAKYLCANRMLPVVARGAARALAARRGKLTKVLVLDLDNTLWGGVIGDDGLDGIQLGGDAVGEAFRMWQSYVLALKNRGYVLAVCSKNTEAFAMEAFRKHPEMVLKEEDIALFVVNWNDKASNIEYISRVLNLGLDSFIFLDDSPFERDLVRKALPQVKVPELPEDPTQYISALESSGLLEASGFSREDERRNQGYREEALRTTENLKYGNIEDYLKSLDMKADCSPFRREDIPRVAQLLQRSNQFNLRTQRLSEAACAAYMTETETRAGFQIKLKDRFGDYGLISVVCCDVVDSQLAVTELVMSCRVLKRGVEDFIMNRLFQECLRRGLTGLRGEFIQTPKNQMVKTFYSNFGFECIEQHENREVWYCPVNAYTSRTVYIGDEK